MRFPSLFRVPRHQQFRIQPRYYDPIKEEIEERTARMKNEVASEGTPRTSSKIQFKRKVGYAPSSSMIQLGIATFLCLMVIGWLYMGNNLFTYLLWLLVPAYLFYRLKMRNKRK